MLPVGKINLDLQVENQVFLAMLYTENAIDHVLALASKKPNKAKLAKQVGCSEKHLRKCLKRESTFGALLFVNLCLVLGIDLPACIGSGGKPEVEFSNAGPPTAESAADYIKEADHAELARLASLILPRLFPAMEEVRLQGENIMRDFEAARGERVGGENSRSASKGGGTV